MIEDMRMRKFAEKTQVQYILAVVRLTRFLGASPDTVAEEDLRRFSRSPPRRFALLLPIPSI